MNVLYEDNHVLVIDKPAGLPTMGAESGDESVYTWAADYIKRRYNKPGNVYVGIVSRLDRLTTGVLVLARTSKAASRLSIQFGGPGKSKKVSSRAEKLYLAILEGDLVKSSGLSRSGNLVDAVWKDESAHRMRVARAQRRDSKEARLKYHVIDHSRSQSLVAVRLETGRKHQIRLQFSNLGHPVYGDKKYGAQTSIAAGVALHSWRLLITHPTQTTPLEFCAAIPEAWKRILSDGRFDLSDESIKSLLPDDF